MNNTMKVAMVIAALASATAVNTAVAKEKGDWLVRFGASNVSPKSDNSDIVDVDDATSATINFSYFMTDHVALELLAAYPFKHNINLKDGTRVGSTKHLPPTFSVQWHFAPDAQVFSPYVGAGLNYTTFFSTKTQGPLEGTDLDLDDSWGWAAEVGSDFNLNEKWMLNVSIRYIDIGTKATLDGASLGTVNIDPWVYGAHVGFKF